jgi:hypothetical protein
MLNHRHTELLPGHILLSTKLDTIPAIWTAPADLDSVDLLDSYPSTFVIKSGDFAIIELRKGKAPQSAIEKTAFFQEYADCVCSGGWEIIFGLSIEEGWTRRTEFVSSIGNLLVIDQAVEERKRVQLDFSHTAWAASGEGEDQTGVTTCFVYTSGHIRVTDTRIQDASSYWESLKREGFLSSSVIAMH